MKKQSTKPPVTNEQAKRIVQQENLLRSSEGNPQRQSVKKNFSQTIFNMMGQGSAGCVGT